MGVFGHQLSSSSPEAFRLDKQGRDSRLPCHFTEQAQNFYNGRNNGQALVTQYVIPDIQRSDYQLVIVAHDHINGYGEGFYLATPTHDTKSVTLANYMHQKLPTLIIILAQLKVKLKAVR